ncbi:hypothetical protein BRADI_3g34905v3 [Brachypodium distachyon]|uniref:Reverse transcriptase zinc-binding domain-containing protein n=1 Tax=Brachypodium distachyon TaxID=15368 RepID=A0A2K2D174_BRADI|nr:hypothetical protein BRADI_3g34905v3 [Brachypodium distachyon]
MDCGVCKLCKHSDETILHALIECEHAKLFWAEAVLQRGIKLPRLHPASWAGDILQRDLLSKEDAAVAITVMWCIWSSRNNCLHGKEKFQPKRSLELVGELVSALELPASKQKAPAVKHVWRSRRMALLL